LNFIHDILNLFYTDVLGPSWSWSYGSWIYNYMCNQCLSLQLWARTPLMARCIRYNFMWYSLSVTCGRPVVFSGYSLPIKLTATI